MALAENSSAAKALRHGLETEHGVVHCGERTCTALVYRSPNAEEFGAPVAPDGRCEYGHVTGTDP